MDSFKRLINLIKTENSKVFVTDTDGEQTFVLMSLEEYQRLRGAQKGRISELSKRLAELTEQTEELNRQITRVQLQELSDDLDFEEDEEDEGIKRETVYVEPIVE